MTEPFLIEVCSGSSIDTVQKVIDRLLPDDGTPAIIFLHPGTYREKLVLARENTTLTGSGAEHTRIVYGDGAFELLEDGMKRGTFRTATLRIDAPHVTLRRLTIENDTAPRETVGQAIALYADGDFFRCEDCLLLGAQDTLFTAPLPRRRSKRTDLSVPNSLLPARRSAMSMRAARFAATSISASAARRLGLRIATS